MSMYKNAVLFFTLLFQICIVQSSWFVAAINNSSDLALIKAVRNNDIEIPSVSYILMQSQNQHAILLSADLLFGSFGGCKIVAQNKQGMPFSFAFYGDPVHRVANGRALFADLDSRNAAATLKSAMMARVFMIRNDGTMKLVGYAGYQINNQPFVMLLQGGNGDYQVVLKSIV